MNKTLLAAALMLAPPLAMAGGPDRFEDYARVREVDPQYERVNVPRKECYSEYEPEVRRQGRSDNGLAGPIIGGVAGGLLGSTVGRGSGRVAAAAVGAAVGAIVGDRLSDRGRGYEEYGEREVRRCRVVDNWESRISGYRVVYEYAGRTYTTILPYDPGRRLAVNIIVEPMLDGYDRPGVRHIDEERWER
ncbi:MAG: glycine zipper 2TM domain-containing protein [Burkholderiales bacterium]|nr:glycine zipper 2TM domain-containing protein [Burkholderiales bacterium]